MSSFQRLIKHIYISRIEQDMDLKLSKGQCWVGICYVLIKGLNGSSMDDLRSIFGGLLVNNFKRFLLKYSPQFFPFGFVDVVIKRGMRCQISNTTFSLVVPF